MVALRHYTVTLWALGAAAAAANGTCAYKDIAPSKELKWSSCGANFFGAKLEVPLDYKDPNCGRAVVPLLKYAAASNSSDGKYQGMLTLLPGGPGGSGIDLLYEQASALQMVVGSNWDIVSFDPRGMFRSQPVLDCALNASMASSSHTRRDKVPRVDNGFYDSYLAYGKQLGDRCAKRSGGHADAGPHMSTTTVARDLISLADAYAGTTEGKSAAKNSSLLNFYGISYGSMTGQTFASMFPKRVGNAVIDGILRPESYLKGFLTDSINHLDGVLALFFVYCNEAGPSLCPYATGSSAQDILARFQASFKRLDARKAKSEHWSNATDISEALLTLKATALQVAYSPLDTFSNFSQALVGLEAALGSGKLPQWTQQIIALTRDPGPAGEEGREFVLGVLCSDDNNKDYGRTLKDLQPQIHDVEAQSIVGEVWMKNLLGCTGWKIKSKDIFAGPFGGNTATPMLFVSNTYDPVAPIENSRSGAPKYKGAQILTIDGLGHVSVATNNTCAFAKLRAYFQNTQLPGKSNACAIESGPFGVQLNGTLTENIQRAALSDLHF